MSHLSLAIYHFLSGATGALCWVASVFFFRFWRRTNDRFFLLFSTAFISLGIERLLLSLLRVPDEVSPWIYLLRLASFLLILVAIVDKNSSN